MDDEKIIVDSLIYYFLKMDLDIYSIDFKNIKDVEYGDVLYYVIKRAKKTPTNQLLYNIKKYIKTIQIDAINIFIDQNVLKIKRI